MLKLSAAVLTADRIDSWIRRQVIQYCCENPSFSRVDSNLRDNFRSNATQFGIEEQMLGSE
jgi:hypothetical protein